MHGILLPTIYVLCGVSLYAALNHALFALRRPVERTHLLFALLCLIIGIYFFIKAACSYQATTPQELVDARQWLVATTCALFVALAWFVRQATGMRKRWPVLIFSVFWLLIFIIDQQLPYGVSYSELPQLSYVNLPWGETILDLRPVQPTPWLHIGWMGIFAIMGYSLYSCRVQYKRGQKIAARSLSIGLLTFFSFILFNLAANRGLIHAIHIAEFGFVALILILSLGLTRALRDHERRLFGVLNNLPALVYVKNLQGHYLLINQPFESLFQIRNSDTFGKTDFELFPREQAEVYRANDLAMLSEGKASEFEEVVKVNGKLRTFMSLKFPLLNEDGLPYAICGISNDMTESRLKDEEMRTLRQAIWHADRVTHTGAITGSLAHEISQPLSAILSNAQAGLRFLNSENPNLHEMQELLNDIARDGKRAGSIINGLRSMLKNRETQKEQIDICQSINEVLDLLHSELIMRDVDVEINFVSGCTILADKTQIQQVILNLIMNALESMSERHVGKPHLVISVANQGDDRTHVSVRDNGIGIPEEMLGKVFDGFFSTKPQGLGVGLAICRSILESHDGHVWVENHADQGVTFHVILPNGSN